MQVDKGALAERNRVMIEWSNALSVNIKEIDLQHQKLVKLINDLNTAMIERRAKDQLGRIIDELLRYTVSHFALEEKYFDQFGYADAVAHKAAHAKFIAETQSFKAAFETGKLGLSIEVMSFLSNWLKTHIMGEDKKYSSFFQEKGLR
jgi:hemerythrin